MALTEFGKAIRKARLDANETISTMADSLGVSAAFLSGVETGRKKIPSTLVPAITSFFSGKGVVVHDLDLLADVSNKSVSLEGLGPMQQMLLAGFARRNLDEATLKNLAALLGSTPDKKD